MTPPPTGTLEVATLGPVGASAVDADGSREVVSAVGDGVVAADVSDAAGAAEGEPPDSSAQALSAAAPAPVRPRSPAARRTVRRATADVSGVTFGRRAQTSEASTLRSASVGRASNAKAVKTLFRPQNEIGLDLVRSMPCQLALTVARLAASLSETTASARVAGTSAGWVALTGTACPSSKGLRNAPV